MPKNEFDYYYGAEAEQFSFVKIPKVLFSDKKHFGKLSIGAKLMYGLLLDRMSLSRKNNWFDNQNRVYIVFPIEDIKEQLGICGETAVKLLKELDDENGIGLIKKKRRGQAMTSIIYVAPTTWASILAVLGFSAKINLFIKNFLSFEKYILFYHFGRM